MRDKVSPAIMNMGGREFDNKIDSFREDIPDATWTYVDIEAGHNVDVIADVHDIPDSMYGKFDGVVSAYMLEHIRDPKIAVNEMAKCLKPGGVLYIETNCCFPLHWYPSDYYRFSDQALVALIAAAGLDLVCVELSDKARLTPLSEHSVLQHTADVYTCVSVIASKGKNQMKIGINLDNTVYSHPAFFAALIESMSGQGHRFFCTSSHARSEWPNDCVRLQSLGIDSDLISPDMMYEESHGSLAQKGLQADKLDIMFDDDGRIQMFTSTPVFCPPVDGKYSFQNFE